MSQASHGGSGEQIGEQRLAAGPACHAEANLLGIL